MNATSAKELEASGYLGAEKDTEVEEEDSELEEEEEEESQEGERSLTCSLLEPSGPCVKPMGIWEPRK